MSDITTAQASMDGLPFEDASFDVLREESSIFIVGPEGLSLLRRLLRAHLRRRQWERSRSPMMARPDEKNTK